MRGVVGLGLLVAILLAWGGWTLLAEPEVRQPIQFPHKTHLALEELKLECTSCHERAKTSLAAGRPSTRKCLSCHSGGEAKSVEEQKLQAFGEERREIPWRRVWRLPRHVFFSHRTHVAVAELNCQRCHGPMETLDVPPARPLNKLTMNDCIGCHETWEWPRKAEGAEPERVKVAAVRRISTDCNACHR